MSYGKIIVVVEISLEQFTFITKLIFVIKNKSYIFLMFFRQVLNTYWNFI